MCFAQDDKTMCFAQNQRSAAEGEANDNSAAQFLFDTHPGIII